MIHEKSVEQMEMISGKINTKTSHFTYSLDLSVVQ